MAKIYYNNARNIKDNNIKHPTYPPELCGVVVTNLLQCTSCTHIWLESALQELFKSQVKEANQNIGPMGL